MVINSLGAYQEDTSGIVKDDLLLTFTQEETFISVKELLRQELIVSFWICLHVLEGGFFHYSVNVCLVKVSPQEVGNLLHSGPKVLRRQIQGEISHNKLNN